MSVTGSPSQEASKTRKGRFFGGCFFGVFLLAGLIATTFSFGVPLFRILSARSWRPTPCTILSSNLSVGDDSEGGKSATIVVEYEYFVDEQRYVSSRYNFEVMAPTGSYSAKSRILENLRTGDRSTCYVNRRDASDAVLERGFTSAYLFGLIPMIFAVAGIGGFYLVFVFKREKRPPGSVPGLPVEAPKSGTTTLQPAASPGGRLGCSIVIALFWNGILSFFFLEMVSGWVHGKPDGFMTLFMIPFELVGLGLIVLVFYYLLALFNPRPSLRMSGGSAALGDSVDLEWETTGNVSRVKSFTITLEGREEATYKRGTSTSTDKWVFATLEIVTSPRGRELRRGKANLVIPADSMHTFKSSNNKILWSFHVKGDIPMWPDVKEEYPFDVLPQRLTPGGNA